MRKVQSFPVNDVFSKLHLKFPPGLFLIFVTCSLSLFAFSIWLPESAFEWLNENTAHMSACCLSAFGMHPVLHGRALSQDGFAVSVITECSTLYMGILFFSFVAAYPSALRQKLTGLPLGIAVLHAANILRIAAVFAIGVKSPGLFELVHVYFGQVLMVLFVLAVCLAWLSMGSEPAPRSGDLFAFVIRFIAFSSIPFLLWLALNKEYVKLADHVVSGLFSLFGYRLAMKHQHAVYYQTFNVVTFTGLVLATRIQHLIPSCAQRGKNPIRKSPAPTRLRGDRLCPPLTKGRERNEKSVSPPCPPPCLKPAGTSLEKGGFDSRFLSICTPFGMRRKLQILAVGHAAILGLHILFRVCNVLIAVFHYELAERIGAGITICGQYILPVALWLLMVREQKS